MRLTIKHKISYEYSEPVFIEPQWLQLTPRPYPGGKLIYHKIHTRPEPAGLVHSIGIYDNPGCSVWFDGKLDRLEIVAVSELHLAERSPFSYLVFPEVDLDSLMKYSEADYKVLLPFLEKTEEFPLDWIESVREKSGPGPGAFFWQLSHEIAAMAYEIREEGLPQKPKETLRLQKGCCRDFAVLFMEAGRALGFATRFVSGYHIEERDYHHLHAWAEVFIPGGGWVAFDPSTGVAPFYAHIPLAVSATSSQAACVIGSYRGRASQKMVSSIDVRPLEPLPDQAASFLM